MKRKVAQEVTEFPQETVLLDSGLRGQEGCPKSHHLMDTTASAPRPYAAACTPGLLTWAADTRWLPSLAQGHVISRCCCHWVASRCPGFLGTSFALQG